MGSSSSKASSSSSSTTKSSLSSREGTDRGARSSSRRVFQSYCLGATSRSHESDNDDEVVHQKNGCNTSSRTTFTGAESDETKVERCGEVKIEQYEENPCLCSNVEANEWDSASIANNTSRTGSSSARASSLQLLNPSSRFFSRFSFLPGNMSFRLSRASSLGSSRSLPISSTGVGVLNDEDEAHSQTVHGRNLVDRVENHQGRDLLPLSMINRTTLCCEDTSRNLHLNTPPSCLSGNSRYGQASCTLDIARNDDGARVGYDVNMRSPSLHAEIERTETRHFDNDRHLGDRQPVEQNVRFSRTLSVGRLRDRVLRRSSLSDVTLCPLQQVGELSDTNQGSDPEGWTDSRRTSAPQGSSVASQNASLYPLTRISGSEFGIEDHEVETSRPREAQYPDLLENRLNFLERRRRIRSQARALQRLGSRSGNLSGHERTCILSGQHRTGRCTCRTSNRDGNLNNDTSARASISRIVMLAEALFEVLDEIHQQSVASRPSVSSIGSVPAPNEVVESLPIKLYSKLQKHQHEDASQCYICLVDYEEGDRIRILPCHHEFHKTCIDKWLKEIHRVCPLCRGDICRSDSSH